MFRLSFSPTVCRFLVEAFLNKYILFTFRNFFNTTKIRTKKTVPGIKGIFKVFRVLREKFIVKIEV